MVRRHVKAVNQDRHGQSQRNTPQTPTNVLHSANSHVRPQVVSDVYFWLTSESRKTIQKAWDKPEYTVSLRGRSTINKLEGLNRERERIRILLLAEEVALALLRNRGLLTPEGIGAKTPVKDGGISSSRHR